MATRLTKKQQSELTEKLTGVIQKNNALQLRLSADRSVNEMNVNQISGELNRIHSNALGRELPAVINIPVKQLGSGVPSLDNIRPIVGYEIDGIGTVYGGELNIAESKLTVTYDKYVLTGTETFTAWGGGYYTRALTGNEASTTGVCRADRATTGTRPEAVSGAADIAAYSSNIYISTNFYNNVMLYAGTQIVYDLLQTRYVEHDLTTAQILQLIDQL